MGFLLISLVPWVISESRTDWQLLTVDGTSGMLDNLPVREEQSQVCEDTSDLHAQGDLQNHLTLKKIKSFCRGLKNMYIYRQTHKPEYFEVLILLLWLNLTFLLLLLKETILRQILGSFFLFSFYCSS